MCKGEPRVEFRLIEHVEARTFQGGIHGVVDLEHSGAPVQHERHGMHCSRAEGLDRLLRPRGDRFWQVVAREPADRINLLVVRADRLGAFIPFEPAFEEQSDPVQVRGGTSGYRGVHTDRLTDGRG